MLSCNGIGHSKLTVGKKLNERIKAACVHFGLQYDPAVFDIISIYFDNADMLAVNRCIKEIQLAIIKDKISSRLTISDLYGSIPSICK